jgi:hypothetical protein
MKKHDGPAPGDYEIGSKIVEGPQYSIYQKRNEKIEPTPGPGEYEYHEKEGKGVTIGEKRESKISSDTPAPGQYEIESKIIEGPRYSMYEKRDQKIERTVGPG